MRSKLTVALVLVLTGCQTVDNPPNAPEISSPQAKPDQNMQTEEVSKPALDSLNQASKVITVVASPKPVPLEEKNIWIKLSNGFELDVPENDRIKAQRNWYLKHPAYLRQISERAQPYLYFIVEEIEKRDMPLDLALLPVVETAFDPSAYSYSGAAGMWQFMPATGKQYGLKQDWWYDGRRDVVASTHAALKHMEYLHKQMDGNWLHTLAAYNSGEGRVLNAIKRNTRDGKPTDFWNLELPRETQAYVPKLLAFADLIKNNEKYGISMPMLANQAYLAHVNVGSQIDLALAADLAGTDIKQLKKLNPGYHRWATSPNGPHTLLMPISKSKKFQLALAEVPAKQRIRWQSYEVQSGDSLIRIAKQFDTRTDVLRSANNISGNIIRTGQTMLIPASDQTFAVTKTVKQTAGKSKSISINNRQASYLVKSGDNLWSIAKKHKVSYKSLAKWNGISTKATLRPGQKLLISEAGNSAAKNQDSVIRNITYQVKSGDSLSEIAYRFKVKVADVVRWNQLDTSKYLKPGQKLKLIVDVTKVSV